MTTTWNPADKSASLTLSSTNHVANGASGNNGVRGTSSKSAGKWYLEYPSFSNAGGSGALGFGFATDALGSGSQLYVDMGGFVHANGSAFADFGATPVGHNISWAIDFDNLKAWCRYDGGNWNNSGTANPSTNTGGHGFAAGAQFPMVWLQNSPGAATINAGDSAFVYAIPSLFTGWDVPAALAFSQAILVGA